MKRKFFLLCLLLIGIIVPVVNISAAGTLSQITATPSDVTAGSTVSYAIAFKTATTILNNGKILIEFPSGFDVSSASFSSWTGFDGGQSLAIAEQVITITRDAAGTSSTAGVKTIVLDSIINHSTAANNYQLTITTKNSADTVLDGPTGTVYFQIFDTHAETSVDGLYYFREDGHTHYQNAGGESTGYDLGTLSRDAPTEREERHCGTWVQYFFDENGTYTQTNTISNIYYHMWWVNTASQGTLGYETTGAATTTTTESFTINAANSPNKDGGYYLYAGQQEFVTPQALLGNAIYDLSLILTNNGTNPQIISSPEQSSFVIINLPDNIDTLGISQDGDTDYDNDEVSDYDELFTYYTNPYVADTDDDGWDDKYELDNSLNPVDPDSAPVFGTWLAKYNGAAANDSFGNAVSSIGDIDGDGKDDVLVGVPSADPGGLSNAGSVYLYSSTTGNLIRQYNSEVVGDNFGNAVSSIGDIDGDGKDDVLVAARYADPGGLSAAGSVYIYSSVTGNLLQQYNGAVASDTFGNAVSAIGDLDGDGKDDVLIGASNASPGGVYAAGSAYLYSSATGNLIRQYNGGGFLNYFGFSVSSMGDLDGDGKDDVLIGANMASPGGRSYAGSAYLYSSITGDLLQQYDGAVAGDYLGYTVSSIGDIDGDGKDDVLIGANLTSPGGLGYAGSAYLYSSITGDLLQQYNGGSRDDNLGSALSSISDIDGDGKDDVLIGAGAADPGGISRAGSAYIYSSVSGELLDQSNGESYNDYLSYALSSIGDIDGDGKDDVLVGANNASPGGVSKAGSVYIYSSGTGAGIIAQSWAKAATKENAFDLDYYFTELNNLTVPARTQTVIYTASTADNEYIDVSIDEDNSVSFSQPAEWTGTGAVVFTATDSTSLSATSNTVNLTITGTTSLNTPTIGEPTITADSPTAMTWNWTDNSKIEESYRVDYVNDGGGTANDADSIYPQTTKSGSGAVLSWGDGDLSPNTQYSVHVHAFRSDVGESSASEVSDEKYTLVGSPTNFRSISDEDDVTVTVDEFLNDSSDASGYYFSRTGGGTSGWIQENFWDDTGLSCNSVYTYSVKCRNGDGVETDEVSISVNTSKCGTEGGGSSTGAVHRRSSSRSYINSTEASVASAMIASFIDVPTDSEFSDYINGLRIANIIDGLGDNTFEPLRAITRAEFLKMSLNAAGIEVPESGDSIFPDVGSSHSLKKFIAYAYNNGYVNGFEGNFYPDKPITRFEAMKILLNVNLITDITATTSSFSDVVLAEQIRYIEKGYTLGLVSGYGNGIFGPNNNILRQESAKIVSKMRTYKGL